MGDDKLMCTRELRSFQLFSKYPRSSYEYHWFYHSILGFGSSLRPPFFTSQLNDGKFYVAVKKRDNLGGNSCWAHFRL